MKTKTIKLSDGTFNYTRNDVSSKFFCERCNNEKVSKIIVKWENNNNEEKTICNGCYGLLMSKSK